MGREAGAAKAHQAAGLNRSQKALLVGHDRRRTGRIDGLLAVAGNGNCLADGTVDHTERCDALHRARHAGIDVGADKAAGLADQGANEDLVALFDNRFRRSANVHRHGNDDMGRCGHFNGSHPGRALLMRHRCALGGTLQGLKHGFCFPHFLSL